MLNKATIIGRLGSNPEVRTTEQGSKVCTVSIATSEFWTRDGERNERTEWHRCVFWDKLADIVDKYLRKGALVYVEGRLQTRQWDDRDGNKRYTTEIVVAQMKMLDSQRRSSESSDDPYAEEEPRRSRPQQSERYAPARESASSASAEELDDDLPF